MRITKDVSFTDVVYEHEGDCDTIDEVIKTINWLNSHEIVYTYDIDDYMEELFDKEIDEGELLDYIRFEFPNDDLNRISPIGYYHYHNEWHPEAEENLTKKDRIAYCRFPGYTRKEIKE